MVFFVVFIEGEKGGSRREVNVTTEGRGSEKKKLPTAAALQCLRQVEYNRDIKGFVPRSDVETPLT